MIIYRCTQISNKEAVIVKRLNLLLFCVRVKNFKATFKEFKRSFYVVPYIGPITIANSHVLVGQWESDKGDVLYIPCLEKINSTYQRVVPVCS